MVPADQKELLKQNILNLYYEIKHNDHAVNLYKEILNILVIVDYPWPGIN
jgi:hypothetical protein